ncbi:MAG: invasin domain 3-containing protein [Citrobacter sp.]
MKRDIRSLLLWLRGLPAQIFSVFRSVRAGFRQAAPARYGQASASVPFHFRFFRVITWVNIVCQLGFPLALAFTPSVLAAGQKDLNTGMQALQQGLGERPEAAPVFTPPEVPSPASSFFSSSPSSSGPALPVPVTAPAGADLPDLGSGAADKAAGSAETAEPREVRAAREREATLNNRMGAAQQLWDVLSGPSPRDQGLDRATGIASGLANQAAEDWLKQYGNARLSFSTEGVGSLDLLAPLWESGSDLLYTQLGARRDSDRTTTNLGLGVRHFTPDWMVGVNAFYDYDVTGHNRRAGVGVEAWRDYLKLSANSYLRLTDWHQSVLTEMEDYDERPANGFDLRAEAYLPAYPQLGGKLMYEHYQGKGVSLTGSTSDLQDNPSAVTVGLNYTPVPLIKVGVEHKSGSGTNDTALTLDFSYRFGTPWVEQINPEAVAFTRSLAGSRYDLVDRNNSIVMQYRKQELISLLLTLGGIPYAGESVVVTANVTSKYGLGHMVWDAPALLAAGGKLTPLSAGAVEVRMPVITTAVPMRARAAVTADSYELGGVAYDARGNQSERATLTLTVARSPQDIGSLTVTKDGSVADGVTVNTVQVTAADTQSGAPLAGSEVELTFTHAKGAVLSAQTVTTDVQGQATTDLASTLAGVVAVKAVLKSNGNAAATTMRFVADSGTAHIAEGSLTVVRDNALADGNSTNAVKAVVTDAQGNPVSGMSVDLSATNGAVLSVAQATTNDNGEVAATLKSTRAGVSTVTATVNGQSAQVNTTFLAGKPTATNSQFSATPATIVADGRASAALQLTLNDSNGNPVALPAGLVHLSVSGVSGTTLSPVSGQDGVYTASLSGIKAGEAVITPAVEGSDLSGLAQRVTLTADGSSAGLPDGSLTVMQDNAVADDTATNRVQAVVTDANGNPVAGVRVVFSVPAPAHITVSDYATDADGVATATLASPVQGSVAVSAEANGSRRQVNVTFAALSLTVKATDITGKLEAGQTLEGQYSFSTNGSNTTDRSTFLWTDGGQSDITTKTYTLNNTDVGKTLTFSVTAKNGAGITGNTDSINTRDAAGTGGGSGENPGEVIDPAARPAAENLNITGKLESGQTLTGSYTFNPNGGDATDKSTFLWTDGGQNGVTTTTYSLNGSDVGKVLTFTVTPKNGKDVTGTPVSINTKDAAGVSGGDSNNPGGVIDPAARPSADNLNITGILEVGQALTGSYTFNPNGGDATDKSTFNWSGAGSAVSQTAYGIVAGDVGRILVFTVTPKNGKDVTGAPVSISTKDAAGTGGSGSGENPGEVIDPAARPAAKDLDIRGVLEVGQTLTGQYTFVANGGDTTDKSTFLWSDGGQSGITTTTYTLNGSDVGKVLTFTVTPKNGKNTAGTPVSINTKDAAGTGGGSGENPGEVIDPAARPAAKDLNISGKLEVGQTLAGSYTFNPNGGDTTDRSTVSWDGRGTPSTAMTYAIVASDTGHILTFTVTPKNGKDVTGTPVSINTKDAAGVSGGDGNNPGEIINPGAVPLTENLNITGKLEVGQALTGSYTFNPNGGDTTDKSTLLWSDGGQSGVTSTTYSLNGSDVGHILTFTVTPKNGKSVTGTPVSVNTKDAAGVSGGDGNNPGGVIDPNAKPVVKATDIAGTLEVGQTLTGQYTFDANGADGRDASTFLWTDGGQSGITTRTYSLNTSDVGKILTFSVTAKNGAGITGNTDSINTKDAASTGGGSGENPGEVIDPAARPAAKDLNITGKLESGQPLTGSYTFNPNGGDATDTSTLLWTDGGQSGVTTTTYTLDGSDVGKILTFTVTPKNGKNVAGTPVSINTKDAAGTTGGDTDNKGEIIDPAMPSAKHSVLSGNPLSITADGVMESVLTFTAKNAGNEAITGLGGKVTFANTGIAATVSAVTEGADGVYTATLTGTQAGTAVVSVSVDGAAVNIPAVQITLTAGTVDAAHSSLTAMPDSIVADNGLTTVGQSTVTLTLKDAQDNPVTGLTDVALSVAGVTGTTLTAVTESPAGSGVYTATLSGTTAGTATLTASAGGAALSGLQAQVTLTADITTATVSTVTETTGGAKADNASTNTLTATVEDANGNRVPNATVDWSVTTGIATLSSATSSTDVNGQAIITVKDTTAETATVTAKVGSNAADSGRTADTVFSLYPVVSGITQGVNYSPADNTTQNTLVIQVSDLANNPLASQNVTLNISSTGSATLKYKGTSIVGATGGTITDTTDSNGQLTLQATDITAESITASAAVNNGSPAQTQSSVFALYPVLTPANLTITSDTAPADGLTTNAVQAKVTDLKGNPLSGQTVTFDLTSPSGQAAGTSTLTPVTDASGIATLTLTDKTMETSTVKATVGTGQPNQMQAVNPIFKLFAALTMVVSNNNCIVACTVSFAVTAVDANGGPVSGLVVGTVDGGGSGTGGPTGTTNASGQVALTRDYTAPTTNNMTYAYANISVNPTMSARMTEYQTTKIAISTTPLTITGVTVGGISKPASSGFPKSGFAQATFQINLNDSNPTAYNWDVNGSSNMSVDANGNVTLLSPHPSSSSQSVRVLSKSTGAVLATYPVNPTLWLVNNGGIAATPTIAIAFCTGAPGRGFPLDFGSLRGAFNEWSNVGLYPGSGFVLGGMYISGDETGSSPAGTYWTVYSAGNTSAAYPWDTGYSVCGFAV